MWRSKEDRIQTNRRQSSANPIEFIFIVVVKLIMLMRFNSHRSRSFMGNLCSPAYEILPVIYPLPPSEQGSDLSKLKKGPGRDRRDNPVKWVARKAELPSMSWIIRMHMHRMEWDFHRALLKGDSLAASTHYPSPFTHHPISHQPSAISYQLS